MPETAAAAAVDSGGDVIHTVMEAQRRSDRKSRRIAEEITGKFTAAAGLEQTKERTSFPVGLCRPMQLNVFFHHNGKYKDIICREKDMKKPPARPRACHVDVAASMS